VICNLGVVGSNPTRGSKKGYITNPRKKHSGISLDAFLYIYSHIIEMHSSLIVVIFHF
jgi:hypothetical protein